MRQWMWQVIMAAYPNVNSTFLHMRRDAPLCRPALNLGFFKLVKATVRLAS